MELREQIIHICIDANACQEGLKELANCKSKEELIRCFFINYKFCLSTHTPNADFMASNFGDIMNHQAMYSNQRVNARNEKRIMILGHSIGTVELTEKRMYRIWIADTSKINIKASNGARVVVDALDHADIIITSDLMSNTTVHLFGNATCKGADKIIKEGDTYDLQD